MLPRRRRRHRRRCRHKCGMFPRIPLVRARSAAAVPLYFVLRLIYFFLYPFYFPPCAARYHTHAHRHVHVHVNAIHTHWSARTVLRAPPWITFFRRQTGSSSGTRRSVVRGRRPRVLVCSSRRRPGVPESPKHRAHHKSRLASSRDGGKIARRYRRAPHNNTSLIL